MNIQTKLMVFMDDQNIYVGQNFGFKYSIFKLYHGENKLHFVHSGEAAKSLVWTDQGSNPQSNALKASVLTITPLMRLPIY